MAEPQDKASGAAAAQATSGPRTELSRDLGCFDITMIGVGAMIGAGIFALTGIAAGTAGPALIVAFAGNGIVAFFTAMVYAELGSAIPEAGGGYLWIKEGLPGGNAFISGWMSWFAHAVAGSLYALTFGAYFALCAHYVTGWPHLSTGGEISNIWKVVFAVAVILVFVYINYRGASETGLAGNIVTVAKLAILLMMVLCGLWAIGWHPHADMAKFHNFVPKGIGGIFAAMGLTFVAFEGYEIIVQAGEEVKDPRRNVPRAVFWCMFLVVPIYMFIALVSIGAISATPGMETWQWLAAGKELGLVYAAEQFMPWGTGLLLIGGVLSTMSALNATTFSSTRVSFAMGRDRNLPDRFAFIHPRTRTPAIALIASGAIIMGMAVFVPLESVAAATDIMFLLLFLQVNVAAITIRKKYGDKLNYGYLTPFFPAVPIIGIVGNVLLAGFMIYRYLWPAGLVAVAWLAVGWVLWTFYAKPRERQKRVTPVLMGQLLPAQKKRFRVLVPVANPDTAESLLRFAARLAKVKGGEVIVLHAVTVPPQLPPSAGRVLIQQARPVIDRVSAFVDSLDVASSSLVRLSHGRVWRAIVDTIEEYDVDFVVMGWRGRSKDPRTVVGRNIDYVLKHANCDAAVLQSITESGYNRVLVPVAQPHQGELMLNVARLLAQPQGRIDVLHVRGHGPEAAKRDEPTVEAIREMTARTVGENEKAGTGMVSVVLAESDMPVTEIVRQAADHDLLVIGSTRQGWLRRTVFGANPKRIAAQVAAPVVLVSRRSSAIQYNVQTFFQFFRDLREEAEQEAEQVPPPE